LLAPYLLLLLDFPGSCSEMIVIDYLHERKRKRKKENRENKSFSDVGKKLF
jgi:hypothetical protein